MKKVYTKPGIIFESFELAQSIASCVLIQQNQADYVCPVKVPEWGGMTYFTSACDMTPPGGNDGVCYHVPTEDNNVFGS